MILGISARAFIVTLVVIIKQNNEGELIDLNKIFIYFFTEKYNYYNHQIDKIIIYYTKEKR